MNELILMTAAYRLDNLTAIAKSIVESKKYIHDTHITWLICLDQYNGFGNPSPAYEICGNNNIDWIAVPSGKPNQKNYGGDMYNEPLLSLKESRFKDTDPWVYILDDDNLICPIMANLIDTMINSAEDMNKKVIWMSKLNGDGEFVTLRKDEAFANNELYLLWSHMHLPDPSQLIIKFSFLHDRMSMFDTIGSTYDITIWNQLALAYTDDVFFPENIGHPKGVYADYFQCTHNAIPDDKRKKNIEAIINDDAAPYFYFGACSYEHENNIIKVPKEIAVKLYNELKDYYHE